MTDTERDMIIFILGELDGLWILADIENTSRKLKSGISDVRKELQKLVDFPVDGPSETSYTKTTTYPKENGVVAK